MNKKIAYLFVDGSVNPQEKVGYGSYLLLDDLECSSSDCLIKNKRFENTSSTKLEIEAFLWALENENFTNTKLTIFTDCQNIVGLLNRREKFENNNYLSKTQKIVKNHLYYKDFFKYYDLINFEIIKVKGHKIFVKKSN